MWYAKHADFIRIKRRRRRRKKIPLFWYFLAGICVNGILFEPYLRSEQGRISSLSFHSQKWIRKYTQTQNPRLKRATNLARISFTFDMQHSIGAHNSLLHHSLQTHIQNTLEEVKEFLTSALSLCVCAILCSVHNNYKEIEYHDENGNVSILHNHQPNIHHRHQVKFPSMTDCTSFEDKLCSMNKPCLKFKYACFTD